MKIYNMLFILPNGNYIEIFRNDFNNDKDYYNNIIKIKGFIDNSIDINYDDKIINILKGNK